MVPCTLNPFKVSKVVGPALYKDPRNDHKFKSWPYSHSADALEFIGFSRRVQCMQTSIPFLA